MNRILDSFLDFDFSQFHFPIITVYHNEKDFPGQFVARVFDMEQPTYYMVQKNSLADIDLEIPANFVWLPRQPEDEPDVIGTYI